MPHPQRPDGLAVPGTAAPDHVFLGPLQEVEDGFGTGDDVEGRGQRPALFKIAHPQLSSGKLPLNVCMVLLGTDQ